MISRITKDRLEEAAKFAYELNKQPEHTCKSMAVEYDQILDKFNYHFNHEHSDFLVSVKNDQIEGICIFDPNIEDDYVQTSGGIFAPSDFERIGHEFYDFLKEKYKGYEFYSSYTSENLNARNFWLSKGAILDFDADVYEVDLSVGGFDAVESVTELEEKDYAQFIELQNKNNGDAWWNGDRIIVDGKLMGRFQVQVIKEESEIVGYIATRVIENYSETYFVYSKDNEYGRLVDLFNAVKYYSGKTNKKEHQYFVEVKNKDEINALKETGYKKVGSSSTYYIKKL